MLDDDLADRTREVWDDEEDIMATAEKLGYNRTSLAADSGPLITDVIEWYTEQEKRPKESFLGQVELRYIPGKGYGLVATHDVAAGAVLAVCLPLAWVSGPPGQPPPLEALVRLLKSSRFTAQQRRVLASLCSSPDLDLGHEADVLQQQQELQQDTLLRAAQELQGNRAPGFLAGSLPLSKAAALQREQRTLKAASDYVSWDLDDDGDDEDDAELDDGTDYDADGADDDGSLQQQQQRLLGGPRRLGGGSSNVQRLSGRSGSSGSSGWALVGSQQRGYRHQRRAPDLLEFVECTKPAGSDSSSAGGGSGGGLASMTSRAAALAAGGDGGAKGLPLNLPLDRLSALVCRNALLELTQDLITASLRGDTPGSHTGIWPLLSLINHSCAPNAVAVAIGQHQPQQQQQQQQQGLLQQPKPQQQQQQQAKLPVNPWAGGSQPGGAGINGSSGSNGSSTAVSRGVGPEGGGGLTYCADAGAGPFVLVRAVTSLSAGDEVVLDYLAGGVEGSLVHGERRRAALAERWGFKCRCERCMSEQQLGASLDKRIQSANTLAARLGPKVAAAVTELAAAAGAAAQAADSSSTTSADAAAAAEAAESGAVGEGRALLQQYASKLSAVIQEVDKAVDDPRIPPRAAAWAHASMYQVHALYAVCRAKLSPTSVSGLSPLGSTAEVAGLAGPGSLVHLLGLSALVSAAADAWGPDDIKVEGALQGLMKACQVRYGPLQAGAASQLVKASQLWAHRTEAMHLALLSPAAAAAVQARKRQAAAAAAAAGQQGSDQQQQQGAALSGLGQASGTSERSEGESEEEWDEVAAELAAAADAVLDIDEVDVEEWHEAPDDNETDSSSTPQDPSASSNTPAAVAAAAQRAVAAGDYLDDDEAFVRKRSEADVLGELQLYAGYREALPPEQRQQQYATADGDQQAQQQPVQQGRQQSEAVGGPAQPQLRSTAAAAAAAEEVDDADDGEGDEGSEHAGVPLMTSWLQGSTASAAAAEGEPQPLPNTIKKPQVEQTDAAHKWGSKAGGGSSSSSGGGGGAAVRGQGKSQLTSLFGKQQPQQQQQQQQPKQQQQQDQAAVPQAEPIGQQLQQQGGASGAAGSASRQGRTTTCRSSSTSTSTSTSSSRSKQGSGSRRRQTDASSVADDAVQAAAAAAAAGLGSQQGVTDVAAGGSSSEAAGRQRQGRRSRRATKPSN